MNETPAQSHPILSPGCLPAWEVDDLPEPQTFRARNLWTWIGPGLVLAGGSIGTGEWVMGPKAAAQYQGAMLWVVLLSILAQSVLNTEAMRYTICTGEPVMTGFLRLKPGPKFWLGFYLILDIGGWWPSLAGLAAQIIVVAVQGLSPTDTINQETVRYVSYGVFALCAVMGLFGGKVYHALQYILGAKFLFVFFYLLFCCLFFVSLSTWGHIWGGLINPFAVPRDATGAASIDWTLISALAGFSGIGGLGNIMASNYVREKGWGMGGKVGAIPSAFGGHSIALSHIGIICPDDAKNRARFRNWFKYVAADQYIFWVFGSLLAMMLPCLLGAEYLKTQSLAGDQWRWAAAMAQDFGAVHGSLFRTLTLLCGLIIMIPGQLYLFDNIARRWTDALWSGSRRVRSWDKSKVKHLYYGFTFAYVVVGCAVYSFFPKLSASDMLLIAGNLGNLAIGITILQTLKVNRTFLPQGMRPSRLKECAMLASAGFFFFMFGLVVNQKILPVVRGLLGG